MTVNRRDFLKGAVAGAGAAGVTAAAGPASALQRPTPELPPEAVGLLYDSTLCIGCKACVAACKDANGMAPEIHRDQRPWNQGTWDTPQHLSADTLNIIKVYRHGTMEQKDRAENGYAFIKRQCQHCIDPSCVSVCPVSANTKDPKNGIVGHDPDRCIGCRYCVLSCPFGVPKYAFNDPFGRIQKCELCNHLPAGQLPACVDVCPTGATLFGPTRKLKREAERRLAAAPGERLHVPRGDIEGRVGGERLGHDAEAARYQDHVYGESELGGTQCLMLSGVPFDKLGLPTDVPDYGYPAEAEGIQHTLYEGLVAPAVVLAGLAAVTWRNARGKADGRPGDADDGPDSGDTGGGP